MKYEPKVLVSAKLDAQTDKELKAMVKKLGISEEKFLLDAICFYRNHCVHTHSNDIVSP